MEIQEGKRSLWWSFRIFPICIPLIPALLSHYGSIHSGPLLNAYSAGPVTAGFPWMSKKDAQEEVKDNVDESGETVSLLNGKQRRFLIAHIAHGISNVLDLPPDTVGHADE